MDASDCRLPLSRQGSRSTRPSTVILGVIPRVSIINEQDYRLWPFGHRGTSEWSKTWSQRGDLLDGLDEGLKD